MLWPTNPCKSQGAQIHYTHHDKKKQYHQLDICMVDNSVRGRGMDIEPKDAGKLEVGEM